MYTESILTVLTAENVNGFNIQVPEYHLSFSDISWVLGYYTDTQILLKYSKSHGHFLNTRLFYKLYKIPE